MAEQLLFKYRSLENWRFLLDILVNNRLYAAPFRDLNDPMEGRYFYFGDEMTQAFRRLVRAGKDDWRICSLTKDPTNTLMWSYYSGGHTGVALGLTGDGAVTRFAVSDSGKLTFLGRSDTVPGFTSDEALSSQSRYLYTVVASIILAPAVQSTIAEFRVGPGGSLTFLGHTTITLPPGLSGIAAF